MTISPIRLLVTSLVLAFVVFGNVMARNLFEDAEQNDDNDTEHICYEFNGEERVNYIIIGVPMGLYTVDVIGEQQYQSLFSDSIWTLNGASEFGSLTFVTNAVGDTGVTVCVNETPMVNVEEPEELYSVTSCCKMTVYNVAGRQIVEFYLDKGEIDNYIWEGQDASGNMVASGVYYIEKVTEEGIKRSKVLILK